MMFQQQIIMLINDLKLPINLQQARQYVLTFSAAGPAGTFQPPLGNLRRKF